MERSEVYRIIDSERSYQDKDVAGVKYENKVHTVGEEILIISEYANLASNAWVFTKGNEKALDVIRKIAATCVRCIEHHGGKPRAGHESWEL